MSKKQDMIEKTFALWTAYEKDYGRFRGTLHGVMDDGNLENPQLDAYIADLAAALPLLAALRAMPYKDRWELYEYAAATRSERYDAYYEKRREARLANTQDK